MKRRQKRYESEEQIIALIDAAIAKAEQLTRESVALEQEAKELLRHSLTPGMLERNRLGFIHAAETKRELSDKKMKTVEGIRDNKLPKLKRILAAYRTSPMPFLGEDVAVVA